MIPSQYINDSHPSQYFNDSIQSLNLKIFSISPFQNDTSICQFVFKLPVN